MGTLDPNDDITPDELNENEEGIMPLDDPDPDDPPATLSILQYYAAEINKAITTNYIKKVSSSTSFPTAKDNPGLIVQYVGETTNNYIHGYFYKSIGTTSKKGTTYKWTNIYVQNQINRIADDSALPAVGDQTKMYITEDGSIFNWDDTNLKYTCITGNWDTISGGGAN